MADTPQVVVLKDLESITRDFVCERKFRFQLKEFPEKDYEINIKPLTEEQVAEARAFTQMPPPKIKVQRKKEGSDEMQEVEEDNFADPDYLKTLVEKSIQRRAYVFIRCLPDIKFSSEKVEEVAKEIQAKFPEPYSLMIEREIMRQSTNEVAIVNLANFSASAG